ncbi:ATP-binding protein [Herbiconiux moechotypicola]|uniref:Sensor histidine kinase n=1 Tax=Herbiconiux moechotypicola TaxID=637393 RepID=A0ABN3E757_9MICO|nr:ATP-binding protein [Herbiconiux moechotypicola]MCS5730723.1 ATP-binding protein [Herbiconiux moechotypicola]
MIRRWSIASTLFVLQLGLVLALTAAAVGLSWADARADVERDAADRSLAVAETLAHDPFVIDGVSASDPSALLQPYAVAVMDSTGIDFITIMSPDRVRFTHRDPSQIGALFLGTIDRALAGESFTETYTGTLGPSVRAVVPVIGDSSEVTGLVSAGITVSATQVALAPRIGTLLAAAGLAVLVGAVASWALSLRLRRVTRGRGAEEMSRMFDYYEGVLHAIGEGLVLQDSQRRIVLSNDRADELLALGSPAARVPRGRHDPLPLAELGLDPALEALLANDSVLVDEIIITPAHVLVVDRDRVVTPRSGQGSGPVGTVTTLRDHTRLQELTGEIAALGTLSDALRSQAHEYANRLHTIIALVELGRTEEATRLATSQLDLSQRLADRILTAVDEPVLLALLLGKSAQAAERGVALHLDIVDRVEIGALPAQELITILGNLLDNALDAVAGRSDAAARVALRQERSEHHLDEFVLTVSDNGTGPRAELTGAMFALGTSTKTTPGHGIGLALVRQAVARLHGSIAVNGSAFTVRLPRRADVDGAGAQPEAQPEAAS